MQGNTPRRHGWGGVPRRGLGQLRVTLERYGGWGEGCISTQKLCHALWCNALRSLPLAAGEWPGALKPVGGGAATRRNHSSGEAGRHPYPLTRSWRFQCAAATRWGGRNVLSSTASQLLGDAVKMTGSFCLFVFGTADPRLVIP
eukprot:gene1069-biopygen3235